jgi:hypothetical protein
MINTKFFQKFYFEFPRIFIYRGSCSIYFFWKILLTGLSPLLDPKNPYIRGDTGGGRGYPHHIGGYMGGLTIILGFPLPYSIIILHPHGITYYYKDHDTYYKEEEGFKWIVHIVGVFNCGTNIRQLIYIYKKKKGNYCSPSSVTTSSVGSSETS